MAAGCVALCLLLLGCTCSRKEEQPEKPAPAAPKKPELPADVDEDLLSALKEAAKTCTVATARQRITCNGGDKNALVLSFNKGERDRKKALPTFVHALQSKDEKLQALAAVVLYASFRTGLGPEAKKGTVKPATASALLDAALALPDSMAMQVIPAATHASTLAGKTDELTKALTQDVSIQVRTMAYRYLMVYGRLKAFETIRQLGSDPGAAVVLAAIESPRNMRDWTVEEQEAICPWAAGFLEDSRAPVAGNAMAVVSNCTGKELDQLLDRMDKTLKDKQFSFIHATALRDVCGSARERRESGATDEQCERVRRVQEKVVKDDDIQGRVRAMCLSSLAYTWPDEKSLKIARSLDGSDEADLARTAGQVVTRLERTLDSQGN